jgi:hypothetical protein
MRCCLGCDTDGGSIIRRYDRIGPTVQSIRFLFRKNEMSVFRSHKIFAKSVNFITVAHLKEDSVSQPLQLKMMAIVPNEFS